MCLCAKQWLYSQFPHSLYYSLFHFVNDASCVQESWVSFTCWLNAKINPDFNFLLNYEQGLAYIISVKNSTLSYCCSLGTNLIYKMHILNYEVNVCVPVCPPYLQPVPPAPFWDLLTGTGLCAMLSGSQSDYCLLSCRTAQWTDLNNNKKKHILHLFSTTAGKSYETVWCD